MTFTLIATDRHVSVTTYICEIFSRQCIHFRFNVNVNVMWICISHCHKTSNALYALVRCKHKRFQLFSENVSADGQVSQVLWHWVPNRQACHKESLSGNRTQPVARYVQSLSAGGSETLPRHNCGAWKAEVLVSSCLQPPPDSYRKGRSLTLVLTELEDGWLRRRSIDMGAFTTSVACCDLQNLIRTSARANKQ